MISNSVPLGRLGTPKEVARAVVFLASNGNNRSPVSSSYNTTPKAQMSVRLFSTGTRAIGMIHQDASRFLYCVSAPLTSSLLEDLIQQP